MTLSSTVREHSSSSPMMMTELLSSENVSHHFSNFSSDEKKYSHEIAKRSAARAALHLGITSMSSDALDVMGESLINFLGRLGDCVASTAECSLRTSSHCNVLDAIQGVETASNIKSNNALLEMMTPIIMDSSNNSSSSSSNGVARSNRRTNSSSWSSLAEFGYGESWNIARGTVSHRNNTVPTKNNGKDVPISLKRHQVILSGVDTDASNGRGWNAPYLDLIPIYPIRRLSNLKSKSFTLEEEASLHITKSTIDGETSSSNGTTTAPHCAEKKEDSILSNIPDNAYFQYWGSTNSNYDQKQTTEEQNKNESTSKRSASTQNEAGDNNTTTHSLSEQQQQKKVKFSTDENTVHHFNPISTALQEDRNNRPNYIPNFLPYFPPSYTYQQPPSITSSSKVSPSFISSNTAIATISKQNKNNNNILRKSLIQLHDVSPSATNSENEQSDILPLTVPSGVLSSSSEQKQSSSSQNQQNHGNAIISLTKASGSRIPRILEGSMDTVPFN